MCSTFMPRNYYAYSKSQYEAPKQLLQLRCQIKPLILSPQPQPENQKLHLKFIEKEKRISSSPEESFSMKPSIQQQYQAFDQPRKMTAPILARTPSSGFSSASSSENMFSGLSISSDNDKIRDIMDPSIEVDLDMFLTPEARYGQPPVPMTASRGNLSVCPSQNAGVKSFTQQIQAKNPMASQYADFSYSNVKRATGYTDFLPPAQISQPSTSSVPMSPGSWIKCHYCWDTYVKLCQRVANQDPLVTCDGPWQWHSLYDSQGRVTCPRLWFTQLERAGADMLEQMTNVRNAPV